MEHRHSGSFYYFHVFLPVHTVSKWLQQKKARWVRVPKGNVTGRRTPPADNGLLVPTINHSLSPRKHNAGMKQGRVLQETGTSGPRLQVRVTSVTQANVEWTLSDRQKHLIFLLVFFFSLEHAVQYLLQSLFFLLLIIHCQRLGLEHSSYFLSFLC